MLAIRCPQCGQPVPVSLASLQGIRCSACGYAGATPPEAARPLHEANQVLLAQNARERQFAGFRGRILTSSATRSALFLAASAVALSPYLCCLVGFAKTGDEATTSPILAFIFAAPFFGMLLSSALGFFVMRRRLAELRAKTAAVPPAAPDEAARCHVCGGPIHPTAGSAFTRCGYCQTDNLTDPEVLASLKDHRELVMGDYAAKLRSGLEDLGKTYRRAMRALALGTVFAFPVACCCALPPGFVIDQIPVEPFEEHRYTVVEAPEGRCIARILHPSHTPGIVRLYGNVWAGRDDVERRPAEAVPSAGYAAFLGLRVVSDDREYEIAEIEGRLATSSNAAQLRGEGPRRASLNALCLAEGVESPVPPVRMDYRGTDPAPADPP